MFNIPTHIFYFKRGKEKLAYVSHFDNQKETSTFKKREETGKNWANGWQSNKVKSKREVQENVPQKRIQNS